MSASDDPNLVEPALRRAEAKLAQHLEEACEDIEQKDLSQESMDELLRLEDELLAAARAAAEAVRLRRKLGDRPGMGAESREGAAAEPPGPADLPGSRLRDFRDAEGREWRVWEVRPGSTERQTGPARYLGEYVKGWLAFESLQGDARKRLPNHPTDWFRMTDADLSRLLPGAVDVARRKPRAGAAEAP
jgi:hypothetical protein